MRGAVPITVSGPSGEMIVSMLPSLSWCRHASRSPTAMPSDLSNPAKEGVRSGTPGSAIEVCRSLLLMLESFSISASAMPRTRTPVLLLREEAIACPSTSEITRFTPSTFSSRA